MVSSVPDVKNNCFSIIGVSGDEVSTVFDSGVDSGFWDRYWGRIAGEGASVDDSRVDSG